MGFFPWYIYPKEPCLNGCLVKQTIFKVKIWFIIQLKATKKKPGGLGDQVLINS